MVVAREAVGLIKLATQNFFGENDCEWVSNAKFYYVPKQSVGQWCGIDLSLSSMKKNFNYRKTSSISRTKSQNLNVSNLVLQLSLLNPLKPGVKSRIKM